MNTAFTQQSSNSNNAVPQQHDKISDQVIYLIEEAIEARLSSSLWFHVQCVTCDEAAFILSVEPDTVREWIKSGKLRASKVGREWIIRLIDIEKLLAQTATVVAMEPKKIRLRKRLVS